MNITYEDRKKLAKEHDISMTTILVYEEVISTYIAGSPGKKRSITSIAQGTGLSRPTVKKLLQKLIDCKIIDNRNGYYVPVGREEPPSYPYQNYPDMYYLDIMNDCKLITNENSYNGQGSVNSNVYVGMVTVPNLSEAGLKYYTLPLDRVSTVDVPSSTILSTYNSTDLDHTNKEHTSKSTPSNTSLSLCTNSSTYTTLTHTVNDQYSPKNSLSVLRTPSLVTQPVTSFSPSFVSLRSRGDMSPDTVDKDFSRLVNRNRKRTEEIQRKIDAIREKNRPVTSVTSEVSSDEPKTVDDSPKSIDDTPPWDVPSVPVTDEVHDLIRWETDGGKAVEKSNLLPPGESENPDPVSTLTPTPSVAYNPSGALSGVSWHNVPHPPGYTWEDMFFSGQSKDRLERILNLGPEHWAARAAYKCVVEADNDYMRGVRDDSPLDTFVPCPYTSVSEMLRMEYDPFDVSNMFDPDANWRGKGKELMGRWKARRNHNLTWDMFLEYMLMGDTPKPDETDHIAYNQWYAVLHRRKSVL